MSDALRVLAILALIAGNAFFVAAEFAVVTARRSALEARGGARAAVALRLMDDPVRVISTVQVGITAIGILTGAVAEPVVRNLVGDWLPHAVAFAIAFGVVTYLSVVLGELVPKALTLDRAETVAMWSRGRWTSSPGPCGPRSGSCSAPRGWCCARSASRTSWPATP